MKNNVAVPGLNPCSSCGLCEIVCPKKCIEIKYDAEGFFRPFVDQDACTDCGTCQKVCYKYLDSGEKFENFFKNKQIFGAWSKDPKSLINGTSGGLGQIFLDNATKRGETSVGVIYDDSKKPIKHILTTANQANKVKTFGSSKYLQSYTPEAFSQFKKNQKYTVIGTPCQIYGLRQWLKIKKWEDNFTLIDFFCHGTPSILLWNKYKEYLATSKKILDVKHVNFRDKTKANWHNYAMNVESSTGKIYYKKFARLDDLFFKFFLSGTCLNEACYNCLMRIDNCSSDIRLADFWGKKYLDNEKGVSMVILNTVKGREAFAEIKDKIVFEEAGFDDLNRSHSKRFFTIDPLRSEVISLLQTNDLLKKIYNKTIRKKNIKKNLIVKKQLFLKWLKKKLILKR